MSRTIRNRHYHWDCGRSGSKIALEYTEYDYDREVGYTYREPTKLEAFKTFRWRHLDKHANQVSPGKRYRRNRMVENRQINKTEIFRWMKRPDEYEPLCEAEARSCMWDWC